jgi:hypothetical protein
MPDQPSDGDVVITTEIGRYFLSVFPHPHRLSFANLPAAIEMASRWATSQDVSVWQASNGEITRLTARKVSDGQDDANSFGKGTGGSS